MNSSTSLGRWGSITFAVLVLGALLVGVQPIAGAAEDPESAEITDVSLAGEGYIDTQYEIVQSHSGPPYVWRSEPLEINVESVVPDEGYEVCIRSVDSDENIVTQLECTDVPVGENSSASLSIDEWPSDTTGAHELHIFLRESGEDVTTVDSTAVAIRIIEKEGDLSGDGLTNAEEVELGTDFTRADTSGNGLTDWEEVTKYGTDPLKADTSGDGIDDGTVAWLGLDPNEPYTVHKHVAGVLGLLALFSGTIAYTTWLLLDRGLLPGFSRSRSDEREPAPESNSEAAVATSPVDEPALEIDDEEADLMTNEEYIHQILRDNDGRMKQSAIVDHVDWSKATVSRQLSRMEREGTIERIRIGRENVVVLPEDTEPAEPPSPGDDA